MARVTTLLLSLVMLPASAAATPFVPSRLVRVVRLPLAVEATCRPCPDGFCAVVALGRRPATSLAALPARRGSYWLRREQRLDGLRLIVDGPRGVVRCHVAGGALFVGSLHRRRVLAQLSRRIARPPADLPLLRGVERLLAAGQHRRATELLLRLDANAGVSPFVQLRLADVQYLRGRLPTAYARYALLARSAGVVGLEGALRAAALRFVIDGKRPAPTLVKALHGAAGRGAPAGRRLIASILAQSGALSQALELVVHDEGAASRALALRLGEATIRRCRLAGQPLCGAVALYRLAPLLPSAARGHELRASGARAFLELGLPGEALAQLQQVLRARPPSWLKERALRDLARAYAEQGDSFRALRTIAYYLSLYDRAAAARSLRVLRARLLIDQGRVKRLGRLELPPLLAARLQRALAVERGTADGPLWRRLGELRGEQEKLQRALARRRKERKP